MKFLVQMFVFICVFFCDECGRALLCSRAFVECTQSVCIPDRECSASLGFDSNVRLYLYIDIGSCKCILVCLNGVGEKVKPNENVVLSICHLNSQLSTLGKLNYEIFSHWIYCAFEIAFF